MSKEKRHIFGKAVEAFRHAMPKIVEAITGGQKYLDWGQNNEFPQVLVDLFNESGPHRSIINHKVKYIGGMGLTSDSPALEAWLNEANRFGESWDQVWKMLVQDAELYNGYAIERRQPLPGDKPSYYWMDTSKIRAAADGSGFYYSEEWVKVSQQVYDLKYQETYQRIQQPKTKFIPKFDPDADHQPQSLIFVSMPRPGGKVYPLPGYIASLAEVKTDVEISAFWLNEILNNFALGGTIIFKEGEPQTDEEKKDHQQFMEEMFGGSQRAGTWRSLFADDPDSAPEIHVHDGNNLADRYTALSERVTEQILVGHEVVSPILFGIATPGALGQRNEMRLAYEIFNAQYVTDRRKFVLDTISRLAVADGVSGDIEVIERPTIENELTLSDATIRGALRPEEIRQHLADRYGIELMETEAERMAKVKEVLAKFGDAAEEYAIQLFKELAQPISHTVKAVLPIQHHDDGTPMEFATELTEAEEQVLQLIKDNPQTNRSEIADVLGMELMEVADVVTELERKGWVNFSGIALTLTLAGQNVPVDAELPKTKIMYRYALRSDAPPLKAGSTSRPFCVAMMDMAANDVLFSKEQIDLVRNQMKQSSFAEVTDVWMARGGWYRPPGTDISVPFCRHEWEQVLIIEEE